VLDGPAARVLLNVEHAVAVRPEKVRVLPAGAEVPAGDVRIDAVVREVVYAGSETRIVTDAQSSTLTALVLNVATDGAGVHRGEHVILTWPATATTVLDY